MDTHKTTKRKGSQGAKLEISHPQKDSKLWKFVDIPKFLSILTDSCIFFPTLATHSQGDPFECALWPAKRYADLSVNELRRMAYMYSAELPRPDSFKVQDTQFKDFGEFVKRANRNELIRQVMFMERHYFLRRIVCTCWHESPDESDAMWKIYSASNGVAIESSIIRVAKSVDGYAKAVAGVERTNFQIERVEYFDDSDLKNASGVYVRCPWLLKRKAFSHEREIRMFKSVPPHEKLAGGIAIRFDLDKLITGIALSPFNPDHVNAGLRKVTELLRPELVGRVRISSHMQKPVFDSPFLDAAAAKEHKETENENRAFLIGKGLMPTP